MRPSRDVVLMNTAELWATRSTCSRASVGAVISREGRILVQGYNGAPRGMEHCMHICDCGYPGHPGGMFENKHLSSCSTLAPCLISVHAEANAIAFAARVGVSIQGSELHTTRMPCTNCAMLIINSGITRVMYAVPHREDGGIKLLLKADVEVRCYDSIMP